MPKFKVLFSANTDIEVKVGWAEDKDDAIEKATELMPSGLCAQCSGYWENWSRDESDAEPYEVQDENGAVLWSENPH
jgi:hypothetical protein